MIKNKLPGLKLNQSEIFAYSLSRSLIDGEVSTGDQPSFFVAGKIRISAGKVPVEIRVPWEFNDLRRNPPKVYCMESWMKEGPEWHNGPPMCWVLADEWRDMIGWPGKPVREVMEEGREWLINNVKCLIARHHYASQNGITEWPSEWPYWDHYQKGSRDYERKQRRAR